VVDRMTAYRVSQIDTRARVKVAFGHGPALLSMEANGPCGFDLRRSPGCRHRIVPLDTPFWVGASGNRPWNTRRGTRPPRRSPSLDPELHGLPIGIPVGSSGEGGEHGDCGPDPALSSGMFSMTRPYLRISLADRLGRQRLRDKRALAYPEAVLCNSPRVYSPLKFMTARPVHRSNLWSAEGIYIWSAR
jgi:hypothetical protein